MLCDLFTISLFAAVISDRFYRVPTEPIRSPVISAELGGRRVARFLNYLRIKPNNVLTHSRVSHVVCRPFLLWS